MNSVTLPSDLGARSIHPAAAWPAAASKLLGRSRVGSLVRSRECAPKLASRARIEFFRNYRVAPTLPRAP